MVEPANTAIEAVLRLNQRVSDDPHQRDADAFAPLLADGFVFKSSRGWWGKARWLANLIRWDAYADEFVTIDPRVYGAVVVLHAHVRITAPRDGQDRSGEQYLTDLWTRRDGRWQLVSRQWSAVDPAARDPG